MKTITLQELLDAMPQYIQHAKAGELFVYPTDTIYGIGAIVSPKTIQKIDTAKQRLPGKHYSIIAPSFPWILQYFQADKDIENERTDWENRFPGRGLTLLFPIKELDNPTDLPPVKGRDRFERSEELSEGLKKLSSTNLIGVRHLGSHPFQTFVTALGQSFITSSCNISGASPITSLEDLAPELLTHVNVCIDGGELGGTPSVVIDYVSGKVIRE